jgi:hypothetical protein
MESKHKRKFTVNVNNCRHELPLLKELIAAHQWEVNYNFNILIYKGGLFERQEGWPYMVIPFKERRK